MISAFQSLPFADWPLHDACLECLSLDWQERRLRLELTVFFKPGQKASPAVIEFVDVTKFATSRNAPWGDSVFINTQAVDEEGKYVIEMQSGDEIRAKAGSAQLSLRTDE